MLRRVSFPALATRLHRDLVDEAPHPVLTRLERLHDRVRGGVEVLRRVLVLRGIATTDVAANAAEPQMDPGVADLQALLAALGRPRANVANLIEMGTRDTHSGSFHWNDPDSGRPDQTPQSTAACGSKRDRQRSRWVRMIASH